MVQKLSLPDGRSLDYSVTEGQGPPLLFIHGTPGSFIAPPGIVRACKERNVPLLTCSRAGYGESSRHQGRDVVDAIGDLRALLDHLGFDKCFVAGWSGGGPHALACAARLKGCIAASIIAGVAPYPAEGLDWLAGQGEDNVEEFHLSMEGEAALAEYYVPVRKEMLSATPASLTEAWASILPPIDTDTILHNKDMGESLIEMIAEAFKVSADGAVDDGIAFVQPWGFEIADAQCPVFLYHGSEDKMCPFDHGKWIAERLPFATKGGRAHLLEGQGHISIFIGREGKILDELLEVKH